eukprot:4440319-Amphidinium_carterae.2
MQEVSERQLFEKSARALSAAKNLFRVPSWALSNETLLAQHSENGAELAQLTVKGCQGMRPFIRKLARDFCATRASPCSTAFAIMAASD